ncbi:MAG: HEAT repeat domain-containing protein [Haloarculaceae archaeon]
MADVTVFGYVVPTVVIFVAVALVLGLALAVSFYLTIGLSVYRSVVDTRRERVRDSLQSEILDRLFAEGEPGWESWVAALSGTERTVVESLLDEYLRELDGQDADRLRGLGMALGIPERARKRLEQGGEYARLGALTWLTLLRESAPYEAAAFEPRTPRERAATVTLLQETGELPDAETGIGLLLDGSDEQFSVFGQDTLYRVARTDPEPMMERAREHYRTWPEPLLAQVLAVCAHLEASVGAADLSWLTAALETDNEAIRAAAAEAIESFGWQPSLRDDVLLGRATDDPSPRVRAAVYRMLAEWGDEEALTALLYALVSETNPRALTIGTTALVGQRDRIDVDAAAVLGPAWEWSLEHAEYDRLAREGHIRTVGR